MWIAVREYYRISITFIRHCFGVLNMLENDSFLSDVLKWSIWGRVVMSTFENGSGGKERARKGGRNEEKEKIKIKQIWQNDNDWWI